MIRMPRARVEPGQAAQRLTAAKSNASPSLRAAILSIVADLEGQDLNGLRRQWRAHLGGEPPAHLQRWLLMRVLAYRLQADALGGLDKSIEQKLSSKKEGAAVPFDRRAPQTRDGVGLKAGAMLVREWKGKLERVMILEEGFAWNGQTFGSLSQIAKAMTGTNWNGHRFFGLRQGKSLSWMEQRNAERGGWAPQRLPGGAHRLERRRDEGSGGQTRFALRDLHPSLDRPGA